MGSEATSSPTVDNIKKATVTMMMIAEFFLNHSMDFSPLLLNHRVFYENNFTTIIDLPPSGGWLYKSIRQRTREWRLSEVQPRKPG